jgi:predicted Zn-dependent protease
MARTVTENPPPAGLANPAGHTSPAEPAITGTRLETSRSTAALRRGPAAPAPSVCLALLAAVSILGWVAASTTAATAAPTSQPQAQAAPPATAGGAPAAPVLNFPFAAQTQEAVGLATAGRLKEAIAKLEPLLREPTCPPQVKTLIGALYVKVNRYQDAFTVLKPMADAQDAQAAVLYNGGLAALGLGRRNQAQVYFMRAVALDPATPASRELGLLLAHQGQVVQAYALLRPWSLRNAPDGEARLTAAALALQLDRPADAQQLIAGMQPDDPGIVLVRGKILIERGDGRGAVALLTPLQAHHPKGMDPEINRTLAEAYVLAGQPAPAVQLLKGHVDSHPSVALVLARAQHKAGDTLGAMATLRPFVDQLPADAKGVGDPREAAGIAVEYGRLLIASGRIPESVAICEKATKILPASQDAWQGLSEAYGAAGRRADSQQAAAKAASLQPAATVPPVPPASSRPPGR